jgi:MarR family transcriptional regulator for hemolysin
MANKANSSAFESSQPIDLDSTIGFQASLLSSRLRKSLLDVLNHDSITVNPDELGVLTLLGRADGMSMSELSNNLMKDNANMTRLVKRLRQNGFVDQKQDLTDKRKSRVSLTPLGKDEMNRAWNRLDQMTSYAVRNISQEDHDLACEVLKTINDNLIDFMREDMDNDK